MLVLICLFPLNNQLILIMVKEMLTFQKAYSESEMYRAGLIYLLIDPFEGVSEHKVVRYYDYYFC